MNNQNQWLSEKESRERDIQKQKQEQGEEKNSKTLFEKDSPSKIFTKKSFLHSLSLNSALLCKASTGLYRPNGEGLRAPRQCQHNAELCGVVTNTFFINNTMQIVQGAVTFETGIKSLSFSL